MMAACASFPIATIAVLGRFMILRQNSTRTERVEVHNQVRLPRVPKDDRLPRTPAGVASAAGAATREMTEEEAQVRACAPDVSETRPGDPWGAPIVVKSAEEVRVRLRIDFGWFACGCSRS